MWNGGDGCRRRTDDPRHRVRLPVSIEPAANAGLPQIGQTVNLSKGGLSLKLDGVLDPGSPVRITLRPHRAVLTVAGRVAWVDRAFTAGPGSAGIAFKDALAADLVTDLGSEERPTQEQQSEPFDER